MSVGPAWPVVRGRRCVPHQSADVVDNSAFVAGNCRCSRLGWKSGAGGTPSHGNPFRSATLRTPRGTRCPELSVPADGAKPGFGDTSVGECCGIPTWRTLTTTCRLDERCGQPGARRPGLSVPAARAGGAPARRASRCGRTLWTTGRSSPGTVGARRYAGCRGPEAGGCDARPIGPSIRGASGGTVRFWVDQSRAGDRSAEKPSGHTARSGLASEV